MLTKTYYDDFDIHQTLQLIFSRIAINCIYLLPYLNRFHLEVIDAPNFHDMLIYTVKHAFLTLVHNWKNSFLLGQP